MPLWLAAMGWLVAHDVWPGVSAEDPPLLQASDWLKSQGRQAQFSIHGGDGRLGTIWTTYLIDPASLQRNDLVWIERFPLAVYPLRMVIDSVFTVDGVLDEFTLELRNNDTAMKLHGERFHADFVFEFRTSAATRRFKIPLSEGGMIAGALSPFGQLPDLELGQRWRMQTFNPVAALTGFGDRFIPMLVEVTGREKIVTSAGAVDCLIVEAANARAWVDACGAVQVQEAMLPLVGRIRIVREAGYDDYGRSLARKWSFGYRGVDRP